jgi:hypothetical protein
MTYTSLACRLVCCLVFAASSYGKLNSKSAFRDFVTWIGALSASFARVRTPLAIAIAASEVLIVLLIAIPRSYAAGLALAACLFAIFGIGMLVIIRSRRTIGCNCFGSSSAPVGIRHLVRNVLLYSIAVAGIAPIGPRATDPAGIALAIGAALAIAALLVSVDELEILFANPRHEPNAEPIPKEQAEQT